MFRLVIKILVTILFAVFLGWLVFFNIDPWLVSECLELINPSEEYMGLTTLILWGVLLFFSGFLTIVLIVIATGMLGALLLFNE